MTETDDWRVVDAVGAWFDAPSMAAGAALVRRIADVTVPDVDLRPGGVACGSGTGSAPVRFGGGPGSGPGRGPDRPAGLGLVVETADRSSVASFWRTVLGYEAAVPKD